MQPASESATNRNVRTNTWRSGPLTTRSSMSDMAPKSQRNGFHSGSAVRNSGFTLPKAMAATA